MSLPDIIREAIAGPITEVLGPMRMTVTHTPLTGSGTYGPTYGTPVSVLAIVEQEHEVVASADGNEKAAVAKFTFLEQLTIKEGDRLTLNGVVSTVIKVGGVLDETGKPYAPQAWIGKM